MINILLEGYDIAAEWLREPLSRYLQPHQRVAVIALAYRDSRVKSALDWNALYAPGGRFYKGITAGFAPYGISAESISFIGDLSDTKKSASEKIAAADIVYFTGGLPDRMMGRIHAMGLTEILRGKSGIVMGYSAGAVIQLAEYHLSPDEDYAEFGYYEGIGYLRGFHHEVHYEETPVQKASIARVLREKGGIVYATVCKKGALIVENGVVTPIGDVLAYH